MEAGPLPPLTPEGDAMFQQAILQTLYLWDAFSIAGSNDPRSAVPGAIAQLRANLAEAIYEGHFQTPGPARPLRQLPYAEDIEELLLGFMEDVFEVLVDDGSQEPTAEALVRCYAAVARGETAEIDALRARYDERVAKGGDAAVRAAVTREENQDTDASEDDEDDDGEHDDDDAMDGVQQPAAPSRPKREKQEPQVDDDGFTMVSRRR